MTSELINMIDLAVLGRLLLACFLGGLIGLERELKGKPGGLRTNILICIGAALFVHLGLYSVASYNIGDPTRVIGQVITGIGFLGAGVIIQAGNSVKGLTSAASFWVVAGIGMAVGVGDYFAAVAATSITLVVLWALNGFEHIVIRRTGRVRSVE